MSNARLTMSNSTRIIVPLFILSMVSLAVLKTHRAYKWNFPMTQPIDQLRIRIAAPSEIPDPANIQSTGEWYLLDHLSSGLASFDSETKKFYPLLADNWSIRSDGSHIFTLKPGIRFHDGTPITAHDVVVSIKRQLLLKTSTHFHLWEHVIGCETIKTLDQECDGIRATSDREIVIRLKSHLDSFFLHLASPETGIWSASDIDPKSGALIPTKFSGSYYAAGRVDGELRLNRNEYSPISEKFTYSPRSIVVRKIPLSGVDQALTDGSVDLVVRSYRPLGEPDWRKRNVNERLSTASTIFYLHGTGTGGRLPVGRRFIEAAWAGNGDQIIEPAKSFLPFTSDYGLKADEFLSQLPAESAAKIRILCLESYFSEGFLAQLQKAAHQADSELLYSFAKPAEYVAAIDDPRSAEKYDYILDTYAASERYPSVQLRNITGTLDHAPLDLNKAESPELNADQVRLLKDYQKWLLQSRLAIPLYFTRTAILSRTTIDVGAQPTSDAEIELWRVTRREGL
jgi:hypothetical protein